MTANPFAALLDGVPRAECWEMDPDAMRPSSDGDWVRYSDVLAALAAERAKVAKLVEAWDLARSHSLVKVTLGDGDARKSWGDFLIAMDEARAAITEAGQ